MRAINSHIKVIGLLVTFILGFGQPLYAKDKWQEGTATIGNNNDQKNCPVGASATTRASGCSHQACTDAKQQAASNLRAQFPAECGKYIRTTDRCLNGPGCR